MDNQTQVKYLRRRASRPAHDGRTVEITKPDWRNRTILEVGVMASSIFVSAVTSGRSSPLLMMSFMSSPGSDALPGRLSPYKGN
jgi:hypothetical protein